MRKNTSNGFTLVEIILVIVILGIIAISAAPRFIDISGDAKTAKLNSILSSMKSANKLYTYKLLIDGQDKAFGYRADDGVVLWYGQVYSGDWEYSTSDDGIPEIAEAINLNVDDMSFLHFRDPSNSFKSDLYVSFPIAGLVNSVSHNNRTIDLTPITDTNCYIVYSVYQDGRDAEFSKETSGC